VEGDAEFAAFIARVRAFGETGAESIAKEAAPLVAQAVKATAKAGTDPYGKTWAPTKMGARALPDAADAVTAEAHGPVVRIKVTGPYAIHNYLKGDRRRQIIPSEDKPMPRGVLDAMYEGARRAWSKVIGA
jgi:hypothetical protein